MVYEEGAQNVVGAERSTSLVARMRVNELRE